MATSTMILTSENKIPWTDEEPQTNAKNAYVCATRYVVGIGQKDVIGFEVAVNNAQFVRGVQSPRRLLENFRNFGDGERAPPLEDLVEGFAFQKFHGDVGRAIIRLDRFVNGDDIGVMNATRGTRLILKAQQEVGVIEKFAVQDLERHRAVSHSNLLGEKDRTHAALAQAADKAKPARESSGKLRFGLRGLGGEVSAVSWTEGKIVRVGTLASGASLHERQGNFPAARILTEVLP
jgi:hypothetical protein